LVQLLCQLQRLEAEAEAATAAFDRGLASGLTARGMIDQRPGQAGQDPAGLAC
jgi:hypothetical protein